VTRFKQTSPPPPLPPSRPPSFPPSSTPLLLLAVKGGWTLPKSSVTIPDPLNGKPFLQLPDTQADEIGPYVEALKAVPKSGLHNPFKVCAREEIILG